MNKEVFSEKQRYKQLWLWIIWAIQLGATALSLFFLIESEMPRLSRNSNLKFYTVSVLGAALSILSLIWIFFRLDTQIKEDGIYVRFYPLRLSFRRYSWDKIAKAYIKRLSNFNGYKGFGNEKALTMSGNIGLQLEFNDGKKLFIGTNKPDELAEALAKMGRLKP